MRESAPTEIPASSRRCTLSVAASRSPTVPSPTQSQTNAPSQRTTSPIGEILERRGVHERRIHASHQILELVRATLQIRLDVVETLLLRGGGPHRFELAQQGIGPSGHGPGRDPVLRLGLLAVGQRCDTDQQREEEKPAHTARHVTTHRPNERPLRRGRVAGAASS